MHLILWLVLDWIEPQLYKFNSLLQNIFIFPYIFYSSAYCAYHEGAPIDLQQQEIERRDLAEYKSKLIIGDTTLPDPVSMKENNWIGEKEGILTWPSVYIMDISKFFENVVGSSDLIHRLKCEYKEGTAYRYFTDEFVKEIFINPISDFSKY